MRETEACFNVAVNMHNVNYNKLQKSLSSRTNTIYYELKLVSCDR